MTIKYKVLKDFQLLTEDKKILILKAKTIIEDFKFKIKSDVITVPVDIIKNNPDYFAYIDWKEDLQTYLKVNKIAQPAVITKKLVPFIESMIANVSVDTKEIIVEKEVIKEVIIEKPKIVEKEVFVDKPKIVEKEVIIEKLVNDDSLSVELQMQINKLKVKEEQLEKEIRETNLKELELDKKEKSLLKLELEVNDKHQENKTKSELLESKEQELNDKESILNDKEANLASYVTKGQVHEKMDFYQKQGFSMDFFRQILNEV